MNIYKYKAICPICENKRELMDWVPQEDISLKCEKCNEIEENIKRKIHFENMEKELTK